MCACARACVCVCRTASRRPLYSSSSKFFFFISLRGRRTEPRVGHFRQDRPPLTNERHVKADAHFSPADVDVQPPPLPETTPAALTHTHTHTHAHTLTRPFVLLCVLSFCVLAGRPRLSVSTPSFAGGFVFLFVSFCLSIF